MEWQDELGLDLYDMDFRDYDPAIARWPGIDPITHHNMSPYMAFDGNPVFWADPSGADAVYDWDGKFNGQDLPSTDYWFVVTRQKEKSIQRTLFIKTIKKEQLICCPSFS